MGAIPKSSFSASAKQVWINDSKLWTSFKNGDLEAYEHLFNTYTDWLYNYGRQLGGEHEVVKDLLQDFFGALWQKREKLSKISQIKPYLFKSFRRLLLKQLDVERKKNNYQPEESFQISIESKLISEQTDAEISRKVQIALKNISKRQREALYLKFFENLSYEEICVAMGINLNTLYNTISSALKNLRTELNGDSSYLLFFSIMHFLARFN